MSVLEDRLRDERGFFSWWRRELPKRPLKDSELSAWVCRVLVRGLAGRLPVTVRYRPESAQSAEAFALVPTELYARGTEVFVDGRTYPYGEVRTLHVARIFDARVDRHSQPEGAEAPEAPPAEPRRAGSFDPGQYRASGRAPVEGGGTVDRGLRIGISLLLALGGAFGGFEVLRRYVGW